MIYYIASRYL